MTFRTRIVPTVLSLLVAGGCAGDGCSCVAPIPGGFPPEERVPNAAQVRVTRGGLDAIEADPAALIAGIVGSDMGLTFDIPPSCGEGTNPAICCEPVDGPPIADCGPIAIDLAAQPGDAPRLELTPVQGSSELDLTLRARVYTVSDLEIWYDILFTINCGVELDSRASGQEDLLVNASIGFEQDPIAGTTRMVVNDVQIEQLDTGDINLNGGLSCDFADLLVGFFKGTLVSGVEDTLRDTISDAVCKSCPGDTVEECGPFADACNGGTCMAGDECLQELGMSGRLFAANLLGSLSPGQAGALDLYLVAGGYATSNNGGLSLGMLGGMRPGDTTARCGPPAQPPADVSVPQSSFFTGNTRPDTGDTFDVGIGVHQHELDLFSYAAYDGGVLCLNVGTSAVDLLTSDTLSILFPSLNDLLHGQSGQIVLGLRPQQPPTISLGKGTTLPNGDIDDPLLDVVFQNMEIDFFAQVDDQWIRVMTLLTDIQLPINLDVTEDGEILPVLGAVDEAFTNISITNSRALLETPEQLADRVPAVLSVALPFLGDALGSFALPELAGLKLSIRPEGITSVDSETFLAIFADLAVAPAAAMPRLETSADIVGLHVPATEVFTASRLDRTQRPAVELALDARSPDGRPVDTEFSYRVDGSMWSPYSRDRRIVVSRESMWLQARHTIEVRAREVGLPLTTDATPAVVGAAIDTIAPAVRLIDSPLGGAILTARDNVFAPDELDVQARVPGGAWQHSTGEPTAFDLDGYDLDAVEVRVVDPAGNASDAAPNAIVFFHGRADGGCACDASGRGDAGGGAGTAVVLLFAAGFAWRRRKQLLGWIGPLAIAAALLSPAGCSCGNSGPSCGPEGCSEGEVEPGPTGRYADLAATSGRVAISAYDDGLGDLVVFKVADDGTLTPEVVDGVPDGATPVFEPSGYRGGVREPGPNVGAWTSIALRDGKAHVSYQDVDAGALKYAREGSDGWAIHTVDPGGDGVVGLYTSIVFDADGSPMIAYMATGLDDGAGGRKSQLRIARATKGKPSSDSDWTIETIDEAPIPCAGLCGAGEACVAESLTCASIAGDCAEECASSQECVAGACTEVLAPPGAVDIPEGTGLYTNALTLTDGSPAVVYYDRHAGDLVLQVFAGAWTRTVLDGSMDADRGMWASASVDGTGGIHVAYQDALRDQLLYTTWQGGSTGAVEVIDDGSREGDRPHFVGAGAALAIDDQGRPAVVYQDGTAITLRMARSDGAGGWTTADLMSGAELFGFHNAAGFGGGNVWVSTYVYDRGVFPPGALRATKLP